MAYDNAYSGAVERERSILRNVYLWMTGALALTGVVAFGISNSPNIARAIISNPVLFFGAMIGELVLVIFLSRRIMSLSPGAATLGFIGYSVLNGVTMSVIFLAYTGADIANAFFVTAGTFAGMSVYGYVTKRNLSGIGHFLIMGVWGLIVASVVNFFLHSSTLYYLISYAGVAIFLGLTAWDTQRIKQMSAEYANVDEGTYIKLSLLGALKLYLDFLNIFLFMLRILGGRRR